MDISDLKPNIKSPPATENKRKKIKREIKTNRLGEYLSARKYYIIVLSFIYLTGLLIGAVLVKNLDKKEAFDLCSVIDNYFSDVPSINMTARILGNIALNMIFLCGIYICGATVF